MHRREKQPMMLPVVGTFCALLLGSLLLASETINWEWRHPTTAKQALRQANVTRAERTAIAKAIANQIGPYTSHMEIVGIESEEQLDAAILDTRIELVDLNADGVPEVIAQGTRQ